MLLKSVSLGIQVTTICLILLASNTKSIDLTSYAEKLIFLLFKTEFGVSELN